MTGAGLRFSRLSREEATERWTGFVFEGPVLHQPDGGRIHARETMHVLFARASELGADFHFNERVSNIELSSGTGRGVVHTDTTFYDAEQIVVTAGSWTEKLLRDLVKLPPLRVTLEQPAHLEGLKVGIRGGGPTADPDHVGEVDEVRLASLVEYVAKMVPGVTRQPTEVSTCMYTMTPAEDFVLDRKGPLTVCSVCSGHGFKFVPLIGEMIADMVEGQSLNQPRFCLPPDIGLA